MRTGIITGASSGMGREFVLQAAARGDLDEIWVIARRAERLEQLKKEVSVPLLVLPLDLTRAESFETYRKTLEQRRPQVTLLINASGFGKFGRYDQIPLQDSLDMIDLNCRALVQITQLTLPYLEKGAHVIQIDSLSAFQPVPYLGVYGATKAFVLSYSRSLNAELAPRGIHMMAFCPGWVKTEFFDHAEQTSKTAVTYFNQLFTAREVVACALRDSARGRDVCVPGFRIKAQVLLTKLLPHRLVMKIWLKQQKHAGKTEA